MSCFCLLYFFSLLEEPLNIEVLLKDDNGLYFADVMRFLRVVALATVLVLVR